MNDEDLLIKKAYLSFREFRGIRYADDIIFYAKSFEKFVSMTERLISELRRIGLTFNAKI